MTFILIVWLLGSDLPPIRVDTYSSLIACERAGRVWEESQLRQNGFLHHACLPYQ